MACPPRRLALAAKLSWVSDVPVVPFNNRPSARTAPQVDDPWLLMAAAQMDAQGRLFEPDSTRAAKDAPAVKDTNVDG